MASAVAASPSEEAGQSVEETSKPGGAEAGGVEGAPGEVAPAKPRERKSKLPGVMTRDDGEDIFPELGFKSRTGKRISRKEAQSEADQEMREEMGLEIPELPEGRKPAEEEAPAPKKIKFGDKEYADLNEAEQSFKSLQGMFKPLNERVTKAEALAREAAESARLWRQRAQEYEQGTIPVPQQQQVTQQPTTPKSAEQELQAVLSNVDGEMFETLAREKGLPLAGRYLAAQVLASVHDQMLPALRESILAEINPRLEPVVQSAEFEQATNTVANLFDGVSQLKNPDGQIAFPELNDQAEATEIGELWTSMEGSSATPQSLIQAIALYRLYRGARGGSQPSAPIVNVSAPQNTLPRSESIEAGGSTARPTAPRAGAATDDSRFARMLDDTHLVDPVLGFSVRRRQSR